MDIKYLKGVGEKRAYQLAKLDIYTVSDLFRHYPRGYVDYSSPVASSAANVGQNAVMCLEIYKKYPPREISGGRSIYKIDAGDAYGDVEITYFNTPYSYNALQIGAQYIFYGRVSGGFIKKELLSPQFIEKGAKEQLLPLYPLTAKITSKYLSGLVKTALALYGSQFLEEILPIEIRQKNNLLSFDEAVRSVHFPENIQMAKKARECLVFCELLSLQIGLSQLKEQQRGVTCTPMKPIDLDIFYSKLPFELTVSQRKAIDEITADFQRSTPQNRLLQGDVGSGKTAVCAAGAYFVAQNGYKTIIMAPTELLCNQHFDTFNDFMAPHNIPVYKLSAGIKGVQRKQVLKQIAADDPCIVVATSAVLSAPVEFKNLGFCVVDEQHRFGVRQRNRLFEKAQNPHLLVMSATPIPRTLALLIYSDLDISTINELPKGRVPIKTYLVDTSLRARMFGFIEKELQKGNKAYIVCPTIEEGESGVVDVEGYFKDVAKPMLPHRNIALLHGRLPVAKKAEVMEGFADGDIKLLCTTTVIEVGVDVPNATVMVIEGAEQFGLATLHQLRGRVGRGKEESFCILVSDSKNEQTRSRLQKVIQTRNGFELAQFDLETRGPGNFFGSEQHGLPPLTVASLAQDVDVVEKTRQAALLILNSDPGLCEPQNAGLAKEVKRLFTRTGDILKN